MRGKNRARPQHLNNGTSLWVQEVFYTLQGEGPLSGAPAVFIRLAGCNLRCAWCDTDFESSQWQPSLEELIDCVIQTKPPHCDLVVITGGEPFRQNIGPLVDRLLQMGLRIQIETNGTLWVPLPEDPRIIIVCSPKTPSLHEELEKRIAAYKYVIKAGANDPDDGLPVKSTQFPREDSRLARPFVLGRNADIFVMPLDELDENRNQSNQSECVDIALKFGYRMTLQSHKVLRIR